MELKLTADKKLLEALEKLVEAISACRAGAAAPVAAPAEEPKEEPAPAGKPAEEAPAKAEEIPDRDEVQSIAIRKIRGGKRDEVKALITKYGAQRVGGVAEEKLAGFKAELEAL